ncbi:MAG: glycerophosphodiester phosphodiesterase [Solirubrobacteraceae bacterium]
MPEASNLRRVAHAAFQTDVALELAIQRCIAANVDMIEIDVAGPPHSPELVVAHDLEVLGRGGCPSFDSVLDIARERFADHVRLNVDIKASGYEEAVVAALRERGLSDRVLISTTEERSLELLRRRHPRISLGWSLPRTRRNPLLNPVTALPALGVLTYVRHALPGVAANRIRRGEIDAVMAHWRLVTPRLAREIRRAGGELYAWTVDDAARIASLERMGVTGVISNDPRLFDPLTG